MPVQSDYGDYFSLLGNYIHLNPARASMFNLKNGNLSDFPWSSYPLYLRPSKRPAWLRVDRVLGTGGWLDTRIGRRAYQRMMQKKVAEIAGSDFSRSADAQWADIRRGWCFGGESFRKDMLHKLDELISGKRRRDSFSGQEMRLHDEAEAERLVRKSLVRLKLKDSDLPVLPKGSDGKKAVITLLKNRTHASNRWIVNRLQAGHPANIPRYMEDVKKASPGSQLYDCIAILKCED